MFCQPKHAQINQQKYTDSTLKIAAMIRVRYNALDLKLTQMLAKCWRFHSKVPEVNIEITGEFTLACNWPLTFG